MGAQNVSKVFENWAELDNAPFRILVYMALVSLDAAKPPRYFAGRERLASALGKNVPAKPNDGDKSPAAQAIRRKRASIFETVRQATAQLVREGAISSVGDAYIGHRAEYVLHLVGQGSIAPLADGSLFEEGQGNLGEGQGSLGRGARNSWKRGKEFLPPRNKEEPVEEQVEDSAGAATALPLRPPKFSQDWINNLDETFELIDGFFGLDLREAGMVTQLLYERPEPMNPYEICNLILKQRRTMKGQQ